MNFQSNRQQQTHNTNSYISNPGNSQIQNQQRDQIADAYRDVSQGANLTNERTQQINHLNNSQLKDLFDEFKNKDSNLLNVNDFYDDLEKSSVSASCSLLMKKLRKILDKNQEAQINENQFYELFNFDFVSNDIYSYQNEFNKNCYIKKQENLNLIIELFDELGNHNQVINVQELQKINTKYNLGLQQQDIDVMIKYGGQMGDSITTDQLRSLIMGR